LWAVAAMQLIHKPLRDAIASAAIPKLHQDAESFDLQDLSNTAWSLAVRACNDWPLIHAISASSRPKLS
jgi:hypothetical protein